MGWRTHRIRPACSTLGRKSYVVQTRIAGKLCWFTIGPHGPLNPDQARARALEILACAKKGIDPRDEDARREAEPSMADLGRRFLEEYVPVHCKPSTREEYRRSVRLFVDPVIGELRVPEVQRKDIAALHHGLRDKPYQANRTLGVLSKMFSLAEVWAGAPTAPIPAGMSSATRSTSENGSCRRKRPSGWAKSCARPRKRCPRQ